MTKKLLIREFFEHYDKGCPYHCGSMMELQEAIDKADPTILSRDSEWFRTWSQSGKRRKERAHQETWKHPWYDHHQPT